MNRKLKKTLASAGSRANLTRGAAVLGAMTAAALIRRKLKYRHDAHLAEPPRHDFDRPRTEPADVASQGYPAMNPNGGLPTGGPEVPAL
jgi:hypothetical protein